MKTDYISDFFRTYLMCKHSAFISDANTYPEFKNLLKKEITHDDIGSIRNFYDDILKYLAPYLSVKILDIQPEELTIFKEQIFSLKFLQTEIITSFVVNVFVDYLEEKLSGEEVAASLHLVETYLTRRVICGLKTEGLNMRFPELHKILRSKQSEHTSTTYHDCLSAWMLEGKGRTSVIPTNGEVLNSIKNLNFYSNKTYYRQFILAKICDQSKESALLHQIADKTQKLTIEHIMPQKLTPVWKNDLGDNYELVHNTWLNTLPNLTLTGYNPEYSNRSFAEKREMRDGFSHSPLRINQYIATFDKWNEDSLERRAIWFAEQVERIWSFPVTTLPLSDDTGNDNEKFTPYNWEVQNFMRPSSLVIDDEEFDVRQWNDLYRKVLSYIYENHSEKFEELIDNTEAFGIADRPLITSDETVPYRASEFVHGIFIETSLGVAAILSNIKKILEFVGYSADNCPLYFTVETRR